MESNIIKRQFQASESAIERDNYPTWMYLASTFPTLIRVVYFAAIYM